MFCEVLYCKIVILRVLLTHFICDFIYRCASANLLCDLLSFFVLGQGKQLYRPFIKCDHNGIEKRGRGTCPILGQEREDRPAIR